MEAGDAPSEAARLAVRASSTSPPTPLTTMCAWRRHDNAEAALLLTSVPSSGAISLSAYRSENVTVASGNATSRVVRLT